MSGKKPEGSANKRARDRVNFDVSITLDVNGRKIKYDETNDISMGGIFVFTGFPDPVGTEGTFTIHLSMVKTDKEHVITGKFRVQNNVTKADSRGMGLKFTEVDSDSSLELFNIIRANSAK
ncbi:MAG: PilZ domain-containing protein [Nitrospinae bacterium]|nr:PilZ domain-containing protein [Nitrospinota bacterium]